MNFILISALVCLAVAVDEGTARWCWLCSSKTDSRCADPFHSNHSMHHQCDVSSHSSHMHHMHHMSPVCKKSVRMVYGEEVILRSCEWDKETACPSSVDSATKETFCGTCDSDGCNTASESIKKSAFGASLFLIWAFEKWHI